MTAEWLKDAKVVDATDFANLAPVELLIDYEEPLAFSCRDIHSTLFLAYAIESTDQGTIYFVVPSHDQAVTNLKVGAVSIRQSLEQPISWAVEAVPGHVVHRAWRIGLGDLPTDAIPSDNVLLWPSLKPFVSITARGADIKEGNIPAIVIRQLVQNVEKSLKVLNDRVSAAAAASAIGHRTKAYRSRYQLTAQYVKIASFSIGFKSPEAGEEHDNKEFESVINLFQDGLAWLSGGADEKAVICDGDVDNASAVMEAMKHLTPSQNDAADTYDIGGSVVADGGTITVDKDIRKKISKRIREEKKDVSDEEFIVDKTGRVRELDRDLLTFILRKDDDETKCSFSSDIFDDVLDAFDNEHLVRVIGLVTAQHLDIALFSRIGDEK